MNPEKISAFLARQNPTTLRAILERWKTRAHSHPAFKAQFPTAELFAVSQLEAVAKAAEDSASSDHLPTPVLLAERKRVTARYRALQPPRGVAA